jgi:hypothetical protein
MVDDYLRIELQLLMARYGRRNLLAALAKLEQMDIEQIEREIAAIKARPAKPKRKPLKDAAQTIEEVAAGRPAIKQLLNRFAHLYEQRLFLTDLRDVNTFLARHGSPRTLESRKTAIHEVLGTLGRMSEKQLSDLLDATLISGSSGGYSALANEIMATSRKKDRRPNHQEGDSQ